LKYRYRYLQRIPAPPVAAAIFGDTVHRTLRDFYQQALESKKPTKKDLLNLLEKNWSDEGYSSKAHEKRMKKEAVRMLRKFYDQSYDPDRLPKYLEQQFVIKAKKGLRIGGRIDRIDETKTGLEIIDYKTGKEMDQKELDQSLQMSVYALAATDPGVLKQNPEDVVLSFYFLKTGKKKTTQRTKKELSQAKKELVKKAKEIEKSSFEPRPGVWCDFCEYKLICEAWT
jgi:RecB family exonuclease